MAPPSPLERPGAWGARPPIPLPVGASARLKGARRAKGPRCAGGRRRSFEALGKDPSPLGPVAVDACEGRGEGRACGPKSRVARPRGPRARGARFNPAPLTLGPPCVGNSARRAESPLGGQGAGGGGARPGSVGVFPFIFGGG